MHRPWLLLPFCAALSACGASDAPPAPEPIGITGDLVLVDDGAADPGFSVFRDTLYAIVARRDTSALLAVVASDARMTYSDGPSGPDGMRQMWFSASPPRGDSIWTVLGWILKGGSVDEDGAVTIPSVAALWPDDLDPASHVAVPGVDVPAYLAPGGPVVATITEASLAAGRAAQGWQSVFLPDGREVVVSRDEVLSPIGHRAVFWDDGDGWRLRSFLADDEARDDA